MPLTKPEFDKLMMPAQRKTVEDFEGPPRKRVVSIINVVADDELDAMFRTYVEPGLDENLSEKQRARFLVQAKEKFWSIATPDGPDVFTLLKTCRAYVERFGPTLDESGKPIK